MRTEMSICRNKRIKAQNEHLSQLSPMAMLSFKTLTRTSAGTSDTHACSSIGPSPSCLGTNEGGIILGNTRHAERQSSPFQVADFLE